MRSNDFSQAPPQARAEAFFLGANRYRNPLAMVGQLRRWPRVAKGLKAAPGYLWHRSYFEFPDRIGLMVAFATHDDLLAYARTPEHREIAAASSGSSRQRNGDTRMASSEPRTADWA